MSRVRNGLGPLQRSLEAHPGSVPPSATVVGLHELDRWKALVDPSQQHHIALEREERERKKDMSALRYQQWGNTLEGLHHAKEEARTRRLEEAEERRVLIDKEEAALREARRLATIDAANHQIADRDERVLRLQTQLKLHNVMKEREEQLELSARRRADAEARNREYDAMVVQAAASEKQRSIELAQSARQKAAELQELRRSQLEELKTLRIAERQAAVEEGREIRRLAEEAAARAEQAKREARDRAREVEKEVLRQREEKTSSARSGREDVEGLAEHALRKSRQNLQLRERQELKRQAKEEGRLLVAEQFVHQTDRRTEMIERIERGINLTDAIALKEDKRKEQQQRDKEELKAELSNAVSPSKVQSARQKMHEAEVASVVSIRLREEEERDREQLLESRRQLQALQKIHQLQAKSKRETDEAYNAQLRSEGEHQRALREQEDKMFEAYIRSQLPQDMHPALVGKALSSPRALRATS